MSEVIGRGVIEVAADATKLKAGMDEARGSVKALANDTAKAMADASSKASRSIDAYIQRVELSAASVGKSAREVKLLELAQRGATAAQLSAADAALKTLEAAKAQRIEQSKIADASRVAATAAAAVQAAQAAQAGQTKLTAHQTQQLSFQLNDLFVQIASGQSPITALVQQGSQLNGTFGGIGGTLRAVGSLFTATRVIIGGVVGVVGGVALAFAEGASQSTAFAKAITLTGNAAGITEGQFNSLAGTISQSTNSAIGGTRETLQALVASGRFSGEALATTARATQLLSKVTGESTDKIVKDFVGMADGVAKWAEKTNASYHFLTAAQLDYIKTLEEQGNEQKAIEVTMSALNGRLDSAAGKLGTLERAWNGVKNAASRAVEAMLSIGRAKTPDDQVKSILAQIEALDTRKSSNPAVTAARRSALQEQLAIAQSEKTITDAQAKAAATAIEREKAASAFAKLREETQSRADKRQQEIDKANALADKAGISAAERAKVIANINEKFKDPKGPKDRDTTREDARAQLLLDIEGIKTRSETLTNTYANAERIMEAQRSAGIVSESEYYAAKKAFIDLNTRAKVDELKAENDRMAQEQLNTKDSLDRDRKVMENKAKIAKLEEDAAAAQAVRSIQEASAYRQREASLLSARQAAQDYFDTIRQANERELAGIGMGTQRRERDALTSRTDERFQGQRRDLQNNRSLLELQGAFGPEAQAQYDRQLALIDEFHAKALAEDDRFWNARLQKQGDWALGASEALANYHNNAQNIFQQTEQMVTNAFQGMEDALVKFVKTGKLDFKSLADSIVSDITRIIFKQQIANAIGGSSDSGGGWLGSFVGAAAGALFGTAGTATVASALPGDSLDNFLKLNKNFGTGRAIGGPVSAGGIYPVNERGPELLKVAGKQYLMMGNQSGTVDPNTGVGGGTVNQTNHFYVTGPTDRRTQQQIAASAAQGAQRALARNT